MGEFSTPSLTALRREGLRLLQQQGHARGAPGSVAVHHVAIESAMQLHAVHPGAVIQAASQFNCLEFPGPNETPEEGVTGYAWDATQGRLGNSSGGTSAPLTGGVPQRHWGCTSAPLTYS